MAYRDQLADVRRFVRRHAISAGLRGSRVRDLVLAASEVAANTLRHTNGEGIVRVWSQPGEVICELHDTGTIRDPDPGRSRPPADASGGFGLRVVRQVCDAVEIDTGPGGTSVRLHMRLTTSAMPG